MGPHSLSADQREQILTDEIIKRTGDGRTEFLAAKPCKAYFAVNGGVNKWWPARLAIDIMWILAVLIIGVIIHPLIGVIAFGVSCWWASKCAPCLEIVTVGERGNLTVDTLLWGHAYRVERELKVQSRA